MHTARHLWQSYEGPHWTCRGNHTVPQLECPSNSRGTNSYLTLHHVQKLPSLLWKSRCAASNHHSSDVITSWSLTWRYCCFYSVWKGERRASWIPSSTAICQSNWTSDRTVIARVAFS